MAYLNLENDVYELLKGLKDNDGEPLFNEDSLQKIGSHLELAGKLNAFFQTKSSGNGSDLFEVVSGKQATGYLKSRNIIYLNDLLTDFGSLRSELLSKIEKATTEEEKAELQEELQYAVAERQFGLINALSHEVAHASNIHNWDESTLEKFILFRAQDEGQALYFQYETIKDLYPGREKLIEIPFCPPNALTVINDDFVDYDDVPKHMTLHNWMESFKAANSGADDKDALERFYYYKLSQYVGGIPFTYADWDRLIWLSDNTSMGSDYWEAFGIQLSSTPPEPGSLKEFSDAVQAILDSSTDAMNRKVLLDRITKETSIYYGDEKDDTIYAEPDGSRLGQMDAIDIYKDGEQTKENRDAYEVLWGGGGTDTLKGSETNAPRKSY